MENLLKSTQNLPNNDTAMLRETFMVKYAKSKGWNPKDLTQNQILEIVQRPEYKSPGMILG